MDKTEKFPNSYYVAKQPKYTIDGYCLSKWRTEKYARTARVLMNVLHNDIVQWRKNYPYMCIPSTGEKYQSFRLIPPAGLGM